MKEEKPYTISSTLFSCTTRATDIGKPLGLSKIKLTVRSNGVC